MISFLFTTAILASTAALRLNGPSRMTTRLQMSAEDMVGSLAPVGFFDPLKLSEGKSEADLKKFREAELKHGRVAMLAFLGIIVGENFNPLFEGKISGPAIYQFQQADSLIPYFWVGVTFFIALIEGQNILTGWESPTETAARSTSNVNKNVAALKPDYVNGDLGFDPLGLTPSDPDEFDTLRTKELQNGRLAMLGVAGIVAQELVDPKTIAQTLSGFL